MKKISLFTFFVICTAFLSCKGCSESEITSISNIETDFPVSEKLEFNNFNEYDIVNDNIIIEDSILWSFGEKDPSNFGFCYNLNTKEKISTIIMRGRASYEFIQTPSVRIVGDSVHFTTGLRQLTVKTFSKKDILENKLMAERVFSVTHIPNTISTNHNLVKLPNGNIFAKIDPAYTNKLNEDYEHNAKSVVVFNDNHINSYDIIDYDSFGIKNVQTDKEIKDMIKRTYALGQISVKGSEMAALFVGGQFILYTLDLEKGKILNEKRYSKLQYIKTRHGGGIANDMGLMILSMKSNDKYILCTVAGYFNEEDKKLNKRRLSLFVFDWNLNPLKRFDLPESSDELTVDYIIPIDCNAIYSCYSTDNGLVLSRADLNI